ncbi:unnamed protein product [Rhodiola kirilowii]
MSHAGSRVGGNSHNEEVEQVVRNGEGVLSQQQGPMVQNGEIRGAIPGQLQQQQQPPLQPQPYQQYPQYPPPYQQYPPPPYPHYPQPPYPQHPPQYPPLPYLPQQPYPPPQRPPRQPVVGDDDEEDENEGPTMGELSVPNFKDHSWCIYEGPDLATINISTSVIHHLPKFSGTKGESATAHLTRYHGICLNLKPYGVDVDDFKLKAFYFSLTDAATDWFLSLPSSSIYTWEQMQRKFVSKYYPAARAMQVRRQLQELKQGPNENMYEYVEKFIALEKSCCNLELPEKLVVEYMLDGLRRLDRKLLEASAGGNLMNLTPARVRQKIMEVAESERFQDESTREEEYARTRNVSKVEPSVSVMAEQINELKDMMHHVIRRQPVQTKPCGFCAATDHRTDECPTLVEDDQAKVNATGPNHQYQAQRDLAQQSTPQQTHEPYRHPHHQFQQNAPGQYQQKGSGNNQQGPNNHSSNKSLEDMIKDLASAVIQDRATTKGDIAELKKQMSQLNATVSDLASNLNAGRLPSQTIPNPKGNVSAVTLRSGRGASRPSEEESPPEPEEAVAEPDTYRQDLAG